jgi:hypothetical protein
MKKLLFIAAAFVSLTAAAQQKPDDVIKMQIRTTLVRSNKVFR